MKNAPLRSDPRERIYSLDALRGFDMFWITGELWPPWAQQRMTGCDRCTMSNGKVSDFDLIFRFSCLYQVAIPLVAAKLKTFCDDCQEGGLSFCSWYCWVCFTTESSKWI